MITSKLNLPSKILVNLEPLAAQTRDWCLCKLSTQECIVLLEINCRLVIPCTSHFKPLCTFYPILLPYRKLRENSCWHDHFLSSICQQQLSLWLLVFSPKGSTSLAVHLLFLLHRIWFGLFWWLTLETCVLWKTLNSPISCNKNLLRW
jgi:hypothetical protein